MADTLRLRDGRPGAHSRAVLANLKELESDLKDGAIVVFTDTTVRIRRL